MPKYWRHLFCMSEYYSDLTIAARPLPELIALVWVMPRPTGNSWMVARPTVHAWMLTRPTGHACMLTRPTVHAWMLTRTTGHAWMLTRPIAHAWMFTRPTVHAWMLTRPTVQCMPGCWRDRLRTLNIIGTNKACLNIAGSLGPIAYPGNSGDLKPQWSCTNFADT